MGPRCSMTKLSAEILAESDLAFRNLQEMRLLFPVALLLLLLARATISDANTDSAHQLCCILTAASGYSPDRLYCPLSLAVALKAEDIDACCQVSFCRQLHQVLCELQVGLTACLRACVILLQMMALAGWSFSRMIWIRTIVCSPLTLRRVPTKAAAALAQALLLRISISTVF